MSSVKEELQLYKQRKINELSKKLSNDIAKVNSNLNIAVRNIRKSSHTSNVMKINRVNRAISSSSRLIQNIRNKFNNDVKKIQALKDIPDRSPRKNALLVGINYNNTSNQLHGCINDVLNLQTFLINDMDWKHFTLLTDDTKDTPTKQNILAEFTYLLETTIPGDVLFFSYSGHGSQTIDRNNDELDGQDELIVSLDSKYVLDDEFNKIIKEKLKVGVKLFCLFDSCFSGTMLDLKFHYFDQNDLYNFTVNPKVSQTNGTVVMISGCMDTQTSMDAGFEVEPGITQFNGAMTKSFLNEMSVNSREKTIMDVLLGMRKFLRNNHFEQIPQLTSGQLINVGMKIYDFFA
jgi:hypothetical protein